MDKQNVTLKARDVFQSQKVYNKLNQGKIKSATYALYFSLNVAELNKHYSEIEAKRIELIKRYGEKDEDTGQTTVTDDNLDNFNTEFIELMSTEIHVDLYMFDPELLDTVFKVSSDGTIDGLTGEDLYEIKYMVKL
jgi:hypothetical protein